jgi:hypothetical protein
LCGCKTWYLDLRKGAFENRALRRIFGPMREKMTDCWRKLSNEELHNLYSPNGIRMIKSRMMRWAGNVVHIGEMRNVYTFWSENLKGRTTWKT